jgi:hypothetical protein
MDRIGDKALEALQELITEARKSTDPRQILAEACAPWNKHTNLEIPDWDSPLHGVFMMGVLWAEDRMAKIVAPPGEEFSYAAGDGTEEIEGDFDISILNMLAAARIYDREDGTWARFAAIQTGGFR